MMKHLLDDKALALLIGSDIVESEAKCEWLGSAVALGIRNASDGAPSSAIVPGSVAAPGSAIELAAVLGARDGAQRVVPHGLPAAPSEFRATMARGREVAQLVADFAKLCGLGSQDTRFGQPIALRFKGGRTAKAVGVQPIVDSIWQATSMFGTGELADIAPPKEVVDLVAGVAAKAKKGDLTLVAPDVAKHPHSQFQRGIDFFAKIFEDFQSACEIYTKEDGKPHPALFLDSTSWGGDSICAAAARVLQAKKAGAQKNLIHTVHMDSRDVHRQVTKARRDKSVRGPYMDGRLNLEGNVPVPVPSDLTALREENKKPLEASLSVLTTAERDGSYYLVIPEASTLPCKATPTIDSRLQALRKEFAAPPPAKRPRIGQCAGGSAQFPRTGTVHDLLKDFIILKINPVTIGGQEFRMLRMERKRDAAVVHYLQNHLNSRRNIPAKSHVTSSAGGRCLNKSLADHRVLIPDTAVQWPFSISFAA